jgi:tRNA 2-thiocytidine biosynthesis protein TtcA
MLHATEDRRLENKLLREMGRAIADFRLIEEGDRILVGVSGGKDSFTLLHLLMAKQRRSPVRFSLVAVNLDQGHPGFPADTLASYLKTTGVEYRMLKQDTYSIVKRLVPEGKTYCSVCSRLRRGILYTAARELSCTKIALGHHRDDLIESLLLSMFFAGKTRTMPPRLLADDGRNVVIRPLCYSAEADIANFAKEAGFPIIPCDLCGSQENLQRKRMKRFIDDFAKEHPLVRANLLGAMGNVMPQHLLDPRLAGGPLLGQKGADPWIDEEDCGEHPPPLVALGG